MRWEPHPYQEAAMQHLLENSNAALFAAMGSGKTAIVLGALTVLKKKGYLPRPALVLAPARVVTNVWRQELDKWSDFDGLTMQVLHGPKKDRLVEQFNHDIAVVSIDGLSWLLREGRLARINPDVLVVDESSFIKDYSTQRFRLLKPLLQHFKRRIILTGTPAPNSYIDLWSQIYTVDLGGALESFITRYRNRYFDDVGYGFSEWKLRPGSVEQINEKLRPLTFRTDDERIRAMLPDLIENPVPVELPPSVMQTYVELEDKFVLMLESGAVTAANAAVLSMRLRQVCNGTVYSKDASGTQHTETLHDAKLQALESIVSEAQGSPVLVFYEYICDRERICAKFGNAPWIGGDTPPGQATRLIEGFNSGRIPVLVVHPASCGFGLNLQQACHTAVWYGPTWSCALYEQANARIYRQGQSNEVVTIHTLVGTHTIEEKVARVLRGKVRTQQELLDALRGHE